MSDIVYPQGCKPLTEDLGADELIRRLKTLTHTLQGMGQDDGIYQQYIPLALHLVDEYFLQHNSRDVQLLVACCIADILRVYAPEAPYKDQEQIKGIFIFIVRQLNGLKDPKDPAFKRYFYLLENLAYVKSFNMCFEVEDCQEIFCDLFGLFFKIVNDEHSSKVKNFMLDVLCPLITEADNVSTELLDIVLINICEPYKTQKKNAYQLAKELILKTSDTLESYIKIFFNQVLIMDKMEKSYNISTRVYDIIYELNVINSKILCQILPQLECKLKSGNESERHKAVSLLARMFSEANSNLSKKHNPLWRQFLGRFCDIAVSIRIKCVQSSMHFLLNHPHLRKDIIEILKYRQHDSDETVRYEVVMAIVETAKRDFRIVSESEDLLEFVKERTLDKKFKIRKEAMNGLAMIYKTYLFGSDVPEATKKAVNWIKNKILHGYYMPGIEDRLLVERLLITSLVPYQLPPDKRMKKLYQLLGTIDDNATKAFIELQKNQMKVRKSVSDWIKLHRIKDMTPKLQKELHAKCGAISKLLPDPVKALEFLSKFSTHMRKDVNLFRGMEVILKRDVSCKECADTMAVVLKKLGQPIMTNLYYNTVKMLLERIASVMVDKDSIEVLVSLIEKCIQKTGVVKEVGIAEDQAGERGLKLLSVLSYVFSAHFQHEKILHHMVALLSFEDEYVAPYILKAFTHLGRYKPLIECHPSIVDKLVPICKEFAQTGTPKQAKHAIRCIFVNSQRTDEPDAVNPIFSEIVESFRMCMSSDNEYYRTVIVSLGHIAYNMPEQFMAQVKNLIAKKIVKELLIQDVDEDRENVPQGEWCAEDELPEDTYCKVEALKTMARWLLGLKSDVPSAQRTFRMLHAFVKQNGDLLENGRLSQAELSWLRLTAGKAMLKICEQKGVGDQYTAIQFYHLSRLMNDPVPEVREIFAKKLHKGLSKGLPSKCLPLDFMGYYALGGHETDKDLAASLKTYIETDVNRRREYIKTFSTLERAVNSTSSHVIPDSMLIFSVAVLTFDPNFTNHEDPKQLQAIEKCLWFILEKLIQNKEFFSYTFYKNAIEKMKNHKNGMNPDDMAINHKMWAICDIAMHLINQKVTTCDSTSDLNIDATIPTMYFVSEPGFQNQKIYIPIETYSSVVVAKKSTPAGNLLKKQKQISKKNIAVDNNLSIDEETPDNAQTSSVNMSRGSGIDSIDEEEEEVEEQEEQQEEEQEEPPAKRTRKLK